MHIYHTLTAPWRGLPNFIVIGAQKSGTTSLYHYLSQHPGVLPAYKKETNFFDSKYVWGSHWYRRYFPFRRELSCGYITGEASPCYMLDPQVAGRIARVLPDVKMVVLLRDPVYRCISSYYHSVRKGNETLPLFDALREEEKVIEPLLEKSRRHERLTLRESRHLRRKSYKWRGRYAEQLEIFFQNFPRDRFYIESAERLFADPQSVFNEVSAFLGLEQGFVPPDLSARNVNNYPDIDADVIGGLTEYYRPLNQDLYRLLGREFDWLA